MARSRSGLDSEATGSPPPRAAAWTDPSGSREKSLARAPVRPASIEPVDRPAAELAASFGPGRPADRSTGHL